MRLLLWFCTFCMISPIFAGSWYVHGGFGLGNQATYNTRAEQEKYQDRMREIAEYISPGLLKRGSLEELDDVRTQLGHKIFNKIPKGSHASQEDAQKILDDAKQTSQHDLFDLYKVTENDNFQEVKEYLVTLKNKTHKLATSRSSSLAKLFQMGVGYQFSQYVSWEIGVLGFQNAMSFYDGSSDNSDCKYTLLYGGMTALKGIIPVTVRSKIYGQVGGVLLTGNNDSLISWDRAARPKKISIPWGFGFAAGAGFQYTVSNKWSIDVSWTRLISHEYIPECNLFKLSAHRML